jgi:hypothetical protein
MKKSLRCYPYSDWQWEKTLSQVLIHQKDSELIQKILILQKDSELIQILILLKKFRIDKDPHSVKRFRIDSDSHSAKRFRIDSDPHSAKRFRSRAAFSGSSDQEQHKLLRL